MWVQRVFSVEILWVSLRSSRFVHSTFVLKLGGCGGLSRGGGGCEGFGE